MTLNFRNAPEPVEEEKGMHALALRSNFGGRNFKLGPLAGVVDLATNLGSGLALLARSLYVYRCGFGGWRDGACNLPRKRDDKTLVDRQHLQTTSRVRSQFFSPQTLS